MAFENVFDSSLVDYSKDSEQQDNKFYNDNIADIIGNQILSGENIPHTFCFKNFKIQSKEEKYNNYDGTYVLFDEKTKICYATEIIEYEPDLDEWMNYMLSNINENEYENNILGNIHNIGLIIVKVPALNNNNFVFFSTVDHNTISDEYEKESSLNNWSHDIRDDYTEKYIENFIKSKYEVINYNSNRFKLVEMQIQYGSQDYRYYLT